MTSKMRWMSLLVGIVLLGALMPQQGVAQDQDDPPARVARLGYIEGSVSFEPAGETDWVQAVPNRPMTTGDQLWADQDSRAEVQLGSAVIRLSSNTGFSFLNLDDHTIQLQLTSGSLNIRVRRLDSDDVFEVDTPNQAFTIYQPGRYRVDVSPDGSYSVVSVRDGQGASTGGGQTYMLYAGQRGTFTGTDTLNAYLEDIYDPDDFDNWAYGRDSHYDRSRSAMYLAPDVVGYDDLDDYGQWSNDPNYGNIWFPTQVAYGWAPYHQGHWDWISPWGWTWVDDAPWGYAPFHYGRWVNVGGRWGWIAGPVNVRAVYAPALVVFVGGGFGGGWGGNVGWFPLGPREIYVPSYHVSQDYMTRVNTSNTTVTNVTVVNVYRTTIISNNTTITNVTYANRNVAGAVTVVPQHAFTSAQPVGRAAVAMNARDLASAPVISRAAVAPSRESVLGSKASSAGHVAAPPSAVAGRQVVAKAPPPPPPISFAQQQQALAAHPGQPLARHEVQAMRPANSPAARPMIKLAPAGKPATPAKGKPANLPSPGPRPGAPMNPPPGRPTAPPERHEVSPPPPPPARPEVNNPEPAPRPPQPPKPPAERTVTPPPPPRAPAERTVTPPPPPRAPAERTVTPPPPPRAPAERTVTPPPPPRAPAEKTVTPPPPPKPTAEEKKHQQEEKKKNEKSKPPQ